jgi:outer membrane lipoprotein-sorting protein
LIVGQKNVHTISADFTQTRALRTLRSPLASKGRFWFQAPDWFRWELGDPPKTVLVGTPVGLTVIQPGKKEAKKSPLNTPGSLSGAGTLGMMQFPGSGNFEEFQRSIRVLALVTSGSRCHVEMLPRDAASIRRLASINLDFDRVTGEWLSMEIVTKEGSSILTEFSNVKINPKLNKEIFDYDLSGFKVTDEKK